MQKNSALCGGYRNDTGVERIYPSLEMSGLIAVASSEIKDSPPPLIMDLIPAHSQTGFDKSLVFLQRSILTMLILPSISSTAVL
jgi:hypothetical protein